MTDVRIENKERDKEENKEENNNRSRGHPLEAQKKERSRMERIEELIETKKNGRIEEWKE